MPNAPSKPPRYLASELMTKPPVFRFMDEPIRHIGLVPTMRKLVEAYRWADARGLKL